MSRRAIASAAIVVAAVALYAAVIDDYFVQDDFGVVSLFAQRSLAYIPRWFVMPWTEDIWGYVPDELRPFPAASYVIASWFGASAPQPNHVMNIALHALNGLLVMLIAESAAGLSLMPAAAAGVIFVLLPIQAESVAWITGRVDSLPTLFYFASFLLYVRSVRLPPSLVPSFGGPGKPDSTGTGAVQSGGVRLPPPRKASADHPDLSGGRLQPAYLWSVILFFAALFSKQNTITMAPALVLFDWIVRRRRIQITWAWLRPYVPYVLLTAGFLALRYIVFHEVARESLLSARRVQEFLSDSSRHLVRLVFGGPGTRHWLLRDTIFVALGAASVAAIGWRLSRSAARDLWRAAIYFGVIWIVLGILPILMSGYYSPRHMYLASLGWAVTVGIGLEIVWRAQPVRVLRPMGVAAVGALVLAYAVQLRAIVRDWSGYAAISRAAVQQLGREAEADPQGTLVIAGVPRSSWAFAVPHSVRAPFISNDVSKRLLVVSDSFDHCCDAQQWERYTRDALHQWNEAARRPAVVALYWDARTRRMSRISDRDDPQLRTLVSLLIETRDRASLDSQIQGLLRDYVALR
jgi:hypothetical protein